MAAEEAPKVLDFRQFDGIWIDPDRRSQRGDRVHALEEYSPGIEFIKKLPEEVLTGIKVSPLADLSQFSRYRSIEFVGCNRECKEQILWKNVDWQGKRLSLVDRNLYWSCLRAPMSRQKFNQVLVIGQSLLEPHNALLRSGYALDYFWCEGYGALLDNELGVADQLIDSSEAFTSFHVIDSCIFRPKEVQETLRKLGWDSQVSLKKVGISDSAEKLRSKIKFPRGKPEHNAHLKTLFVFPVKRKLFCVFCIRA